MHLVSSGSMPVNSRARWTCINNRVLCAKITSCKLLTFFKAVLKFLKPCVVLSALNEMLIRVMGTAENQKRKLITVQ